jgi:hypothetical protein
MVIESGGDLLNPLGEQVNQNANLKVINEQGEEQYVSVDSKTFQIETEEAVYEPAIVQELEWENDGKQTETSDQCGNTKRARTRQENRSATVRGICTDNRRQIGSAEDGRPIYNLTASEIHNNLGTAATSSQFTANSTVGIITQLYSGDIEIGNTVVRQQQDLVSVNMGVGDELAFKFQIQLGATDG